MPSYSKPALSSEQHLALWQTRGLSIPSSERALHYLEHISYYRLSAYALPFYESAASHRFRPGSSFDDVLQNYVFDRELRLLVLDALERVEVSIRAHIANEMALRAVNSPFWYLDETHFKAEFPHKRLLADLERQMDEERQRLSNDERHVDNRKHLTPEQKDRLKARLRKENFIRHYLCEYPSPRLPPCWMAMEMLTWGQLSRLYAGLRRTADQKAIAHRLGLHAELLESWLRALNSIRNICAHHGRLWNRELGVSLRLPNSRQVRWLQNPVILDPSGPQVDYKKRIYPVLAALQTLLYKISPGSAWALRLKALLEKYPNIRLSAMGIPSNWQEDPFWREALMHLPSKQSPSTKT